MSVGCHLRIPTTGSIEKQCLQTDAWVARMALYSGYKCAISLAARWMFLLQFHELWQLMMTSKTCLG
jgi:hypothetical protein